MQSFQEFSLSPELARAIQEMGFETPTPIQAQALPKLLAGKTDFLGLAATGTGKTGAFAIPLIERVDPNVHGAQAIVLCPTRELAVQVAGQINLLGRYKRVRALPVYGGAPYGDQIRGLRDGAPIVVATPGRLVDHLNRGTAEFSKVRTVVLDEADEMISMGFKDDLEAILLQVDEAQRETWLFSATMSKEVRKIADRFLMEPASVEINTSKMLSGTVEQKFYVCKEMDKPEILMKLIDFADDFYGLIFCQTKNLVIELTDLLNSKGYAADCLHGDMDQKARDRAMRAFREKNTKVMVCTDVACRGLDVQDLTHVVNYSIPRELDNYVHRIGRTGRSGKKGLALSLVTPSHMPLITKIERMTKSKMFRDTVPSRKEVAKKKLAGACAPFLAAEPARVLEVLGQEWLDAIESMEKAEIVSRFLSLKFGDLFTAPVETQAPKVSNDRPARAMPLVVPKPMSIVPLIPLTPSAATTGLIRLEDIDLSDEESAEEEVQEEPATQVAAPQGGNRPLKIPAPVPRSISVRPAPQGFVGRREERGAFGGGYGKKPGGYGAPREDRGGFGGGYGKKPGGYGAPREDRGGFGGYGKKPGGFYGAPRAERTGGGFGGGGTSGGYGKKPGGFGKTGGFGKKPEYTGGWSKPRRERGSSFEA